MKEENLLKRLVQLTEYVTSDGDTELKIASLYTIKNLLYNTNKETKA